MAVRTIEDLTEQETARLMEKVKKVLGGYDMMATEMLILQAAFEVLDTVEHQVLGRGHDEIRQRLLQAYDAFAEQNPHERAH